MLGIPADVNITRQFRVLVGMLAREPLREFWDYLSIEGFYFGDFGLNVRALDSKVWAICQEQKLVLITANRKAAGPDSLEETIRNNNSPESYPVLTFSDPTRFLKDKAYASKVADNVLDFLLDIEIYRGSGRLYVP